MTMRQWKQLNQFATVLMGQSPSSSACSEDGSGLPFIQGNAEFGVRYPEPRLRCSVPTRICEKGDFLLSVRAPVGELNQSNLKMVIGRGLSAIRFPEYDQPFSWHSLKSAVHRLNRVAQGSTFVAVSRRDVECLEIPWFPEDSYRQNVAYILDTIDEAITKTEAVIAKLKQVRTGMLHDLLSYGLDEHGQLRDPIAHPEQFKESPLGRIPIGWDVYTIEQLNILIIDGDRGSNYPSEAHLFDQGFCVFLNNKNIKDGKLDFSSTQFITKERDALLRKGKLKVGDIVITTRGTVGNIALFEMGKPYEHIRINSGMVIIRNYGEKFEAHFFVDIWQHLFPSEYRRLSSGSAQPQFPIRDMYGFRLIVPPKPEQRLIVGMILKSNYSIDKHEDELVKFKKIKSGLQDDLLTGRVRVRETIVEGAAVA